MRKAHVVAAVAVVLACQRGVRDPRVGTIELVLEPVQRAAAPAPAPELERTREVVARRLAGLRVPVEVATEGGQLVVAVRGDVEQEVLSRVKATALMQGRFEVRELDGETLGPTLVDGGAVKDALSTIAGDRAAISITLRPEAAGPFEAATRRLIGSRLALIVDDRMLAAPVVQAAIPGGRIQVTLGPYASSRALADSIVAALRAGAPLPVPLRLREERRVAPRGR